MLGNRRVVKSAYISIIETIVGGLGLFFLYKYLYEKIGIENIGILSIVTAITAFSRFSEFGLSASTLKYVAKYLHKKDVKSVVGVVQSSGTSTFLMTALVSALLYYPFCYAIESSVSDELRVGALSLLPIVLVTVVTNSILGVMRAGLEGLSRYDLKSYTSMLFLGFHLVLVVYLVDDYGVMGVVISQVLSSLLEAMTCYFLLCNRLKTLFIPIGAFDLKLFKEMFGYGVSFQGAAIAAMFIDPLVKVLLGKFGGAGIVGYFEMANRMIGQFRALLVSGNKVLVPIYAEMDVDHSKDKGRLYITSFSIVMTMLCNITLGVLVFLPVISYLWLGRFVDEFIGVSVFIMVSRYFHSLIIPAFFSNLGTGRLKWNFVSQVSMGLSNMIFGIPFGYFWGWKGVMVSYFVSMIVGFLVIFISHHKENSILIPDLFDKDLTVVFVFFLIGVTFWTISSVFFEYTEFEYFALSLPFFLVLLSLSVSRGPLGQAIFSGRVRRF